MTIETCTLVRYNFTLGSLYSMNLGNVLKPTFRAPRIIGFNLCLLKHSPPLFVLPTETIPDYSSKELESATV